MSVKQLKDGIIRLMLKGLRGREEGRRIRKIFTLKSKAGNSRKITFFRISHNNGNGIRINSGYQN